jgi:hypothetical protein
MEISLPGLALPIDSVFVGVVAFSWSDIDARETSSERGDLGKVDDITESLDVGASRRKLQSKPFLSQFAHDGCLTSHCFRS